MGNVVDELHTLRKLRRGGMPLVAVTVDGDAPCAGKAIKNLRVPPSTFFVAIMRSSRLVVPGAETVVEAGDELLALSTTTDERRLRATLLEK